MLQEYEKDADKYRRSLQQKIPKPKDDPRAVIDSEVKRVNGRFKEVVGACTAMMAKLTETAGKNKQYNDLKARLTTSLPEMEARMDSCAGQFVPGQDPREQLQALESLTKDVIAEGKHVEDLRSLGDDLLAILEALDCADTPKAREIQNTVEGVAGKYDFIQEGVVDKQHRITKAITESQDVHHTLDGLMGWIFETEAVFDSMKPVSLDRAALNNQIQAHRVLVSDMESHKGRIDGVVEQTHDAAGADDKLEQLVDRFDILDSRAQQRGAELEEVVQKLGQSEVFVYQAPDRGFLPLSLYPLT